LALHFSRRSVSLVRSMTAKALLLMFSGPVFTACLLSSCSKAPTPVTQKRHLAPEGVLYLIERTSVATASGVIGFQPGTKVALLRMTGDKLLVSCEEYTFEIAQDKATNDLDLAELVRRTDTQSQAALLRYLNEQRTAGAAQRERDNALFDQQQKEASARRIAAALAQENHSSLNKGAYNRAVALPYVYGYSAYGYPYYYRPVYSNPP
jgi:hypothetical protein